jgi:hypothetical protein
MLQNFGHAVVVQFLPIHFQHQRSRIKELPGAAQVTVKVKQQTHNGTVINYTLGMSGPAIETLAWGAESCMTKIISLPFS